ncbi:MAG: substrate-binding domain-containing protein [Clostridia bacterium]|nr:substrate-binding domain-containing protein [Clostridia bacterium]
MERKEPMKISFITVIMIILIVALISVGIVYFIFINNKDNGTTNTNIENVVSTNNIETKISEKLKMTEEEFPKVDGATAMLPMVGEITKTVLGYTDEQAQKYLDENTQGKSAKVYASLINKEKDLIFVSEPSDDILRQAKEANVEFDMTGIGKDGFVFIVNKNNPVNSLTIEQIQKIYTGEITNWSQVGGNNEEIVAYQREQNSGSQNLMEKMVMKGTKMKTAPSGLMIASMEGLIDSVAKGYDNSKASIGYSIYLYAKEQYVKDNIKFLSIDGVYPSDETIANGTYPLSKIVYAVTRKDVPQDSNARKLTKWLLTDEGQKIVEAGGYSKLK